MKIYFKNDPGSLTLKTASPFWHWQYHWPRC